MKDTIKALIEHVCGQAEFDEDKAFEGLENVIEYDWQKRFVRLLGRLADEVDEKPEPAKAETPPLQNAAICALADLIGEYEKGGLEDSAKKSIVELFDALVEEKHPRIENYRDDVQNVRDDLDDDDDYRPVDFPPDQHLRGLP